MTTPKASELVRNPDATVNLPLTLDELHALRALLDMSCHMLEPDRTPRDEPAFTACEKVANLNSEIWGPAAMERIGPPLDPHPDDN